MARTMAATADAANPENDGLEFGSDVECDEDGDGDSDTKNDTCDGEGGNHGDEVAPRTCDENVTEPSDDVATAKAALWMSGKW